MSLTCQFRRRNKKANDLRLELLRMGCYDADPKRQAMLLWKLLAQDELKHILFVSKKKECR